jgi:hypothetical protein
MKVTENKKNKRTQPDYNLGFKSTKRVFAGKTVGARNTVGNAAARNAETGLFAERKVFG